MNTNLRVNFKNLKIEKKKLFYLLANPLLMMNSDNVNRNTWLKFNKKWF